MAIKMATKYGLPERIDDTQAIHIESCREAHARACKAHAMYVAKPYGSEAQRTENQRWLEAEINRTHGLWIGARRAVGLEEN